MISASLEIAFVAAFGAMALAGVLQSFLWPSFHKRQARLNPKQYTRAIFGYAAIPFAAGLAVMVACAAVPLAAGFNIVPTHCHAGMDVGYCSPHEPMNLSEPVVAPVVAVIALMLLSVFICFGRRALVHRAICRELDANTRYDPVLNAWTMESDDLSAFCVGLFARRVVVSRGLINSLSAAELQIVLNHERGHARRRDGLGVLLLQLMTLPFLPEARKGLADEFLLSIEYECDRYAAELCGDSLDVAATLVRLGRLRLNARRRERDFQTGFVFPALGQSLERRVSWLIQAPGPGDAGVAEIVERLICYAIVVAFIVAEPLHLGLEHALARLSS